MASNQTRYVNRKAANNKGRKVEDLQNKTSSLIEILQSFGIIVKTKLNFKKQNNNLEQEFLEYFMDRRNGMPRFEGETDRKVIEKHLENETTLSNRKEYLINTKKSKIVVRFKCDYDHMNVLKDIPSREAFNGIGTINRKSLFESNLRADRTNSNIMHIEFDLKFDSVLEIIKYFKISDHKNVNLMLENEILGRLVEILDVDNEKKHVYIKLKTFETESTYNLCHYILMGKIDGSNSCFMLDMTHHSATLKTIDSIYRHFTPPQFRKRIYKKGNATNTFHDCKEAGIYRVLIGCFFDCITDPSAGYYNKCCSIHPYNFKEVRNDPEVLETGDSFGIMVERTKVYPYHSAYLNRQFSELASGIVNVGYYHFELQAICRYKFGDLKFRREFYHFSL